MYEIRCADAGGDCAFTVRSSDRDEVIEVARRHGRTKHDMEVSRSDASDLVREV